jgi:hypothetical protein
MMSRLHQDPFENLMAIKKPEKRSFPVLSQRFATPLRLQVNYSRRLRLLVITFFLLSLLAILLTQISLLLKLAIALCVVGLFITAWRSRPELGAEKVELILRPNGAWLLQRKDESIALQLHGQSTVSRWLLLLCFKERDGRRRFDYLLWQVEQPPMLFRRLRVYLRLYAADTQR